MHAKYFDLIVAVVLGIFLLFFGMGCTLEILQHTEEPSGWQQVIEGVEELVHAIEHSETIVDVWPGDD